MSVMFQPQIAQLSDTPYRCLVRVSTSSAGTSKPSLAAALVSKLCAMILSKSNAVSTLELVLCKQKHNPWGSASQQLLKS